MSDSCLVKHRGRVLRSAALLIVLAAGAAILAAPQPLWAATSSPVTAAHVEARLVTAQEGFAPGEPFWIGLSLKHEPTWHTYWINPGDSGFATSIKWELPDGFTAGPLQFPYPHFFMGGGDLAGYGFEGETMLFTRITPPANLAPGTEITLKGKAGWLACDPGSCFPGNAALEIALTASDNPSPSPAPSKAAFEKHLAQVPKPAPGWILTAADNGDAFGLRVQLPAGTVVAAEGLHFFPEKSGIVAAGAPQAFALAEPGILETRLAKKNPDTALPETLTGVLYAPGGLGDLGKAVLLSTAGAPPPENATPGTPASTTEAANTPASSPSSLSSPSIGLFAALGFAFIGGLILNLMPCVFPVISLKIMSFVNQAGEDPRKIMMHGFVFAAGVLVSFWALSGTLIALRSVFHVDVGWGFQLQEPAFVMAMSVLLFVLALSLFGVFEIGTGLTGVGGQLVTKSGFAGSFWSGALATVLATPCAAPFMGPAVAYALGQPPAMSLFVFTFLGLGMALPYILLSLFPGLLKFVPRPGPWMETFKQIMGFPMLAVVIWLLWILGLLVGINGLLFHIVTLFAVGLAAWTLGRFATPSRKPASRHLARLAALVVVVLGAYTSVKAAGFTAQPATHADADSIWIPYSEEAVAKNLAEGRAVFIDFTAAWCLTCQTNKIALHAKEVETAAAAKNIVFMEADWTNRDPAISAALEKHGRASIPFYVLIDPKNQDAPITLDGLISASDLLESFEKIKG